MADRHRVVIVGGGFGGLAAARALKNAPVEVTLVDRRNFHLFQPLLYQVATGELSPANIASPLRAILRHQKNARVLLGTVEGADLERRCVKLDDRELPYDSLIVAAGARHSYFGNDQWEQFAPGLKTIEDATLIRHRLLFAFEAAERETDPQKRAAWLTFAIIGGGPTGVELAGALSEIAHHTLKHDFRSINPQDATILLVEAAEHPLAMYSQKLADAACASLEKLNVTIRRKSKVTDINAGGLTVECAGQSEFLAAKTVVWAAGVAASPLGKQLAEQTGATTDRAGRLVVNQDFSLPGHPEVFAIGDLASYTPSGAEHPLPGLAPVALQSGRYVGRLIARRLRDGSPTTGGASGQFEYRDRGSMAVIGRYAAIAKTGFGEFSGITAWLLWVLIHLREITQFRNRLLVLLQWVYAFVARDRSARLITNVLRSESQGE